MTGPLISKLNSLQKSFKNSTDFSFALLGMNSFFFKNGKVFKATCKIKQLEIEVVAMPTRCTKDILIKLFDEEGRQQDAYLSSDSFVIQEESSEVPCAIADILTINNQLKLTRNKEHKIGLILVRNDTKISTLELQPSNQQELNCKLRRIF